MFGQTSSFGTNNNTNNNSPFGGGQTSSGFGGFGSSNNNNNNNNNTSPFGGGGGFGSNANNNNTNAFGSTNNNAFGSTSSTPFGSPPANSGGGLFGSSSNNTNTFGTSSGGFSAPAPTTSLFGAPAAAPSSSIFGAPSTSANTGGLFGSNNNTSNTGGGLFGNSTSNTTSSFGGFGSPAPAPQSSGFGFGSSNTTTTSNTFGASNTFGTSNQSTGLFGAPAASSSPFGGGATNTGTVTSKSAAYQPTDQQDGLSNTRIQLQSITAMSQYSNVSFEELRMNDYLSGNKGSGGSSGTFGGSSMFGGNNTQSSGLFGTTAPAPSTGFSFGSAPKPAPGFSSGGFGGGAPAPSLFGAPSPAPSGSLFGAPAPSSNSGGLFGAPATSAPTGGFGFGNTTSPAPAQNQTGLFGSAPSTGGGLFGNTPAPSTGLFGAPAPAAPSSGGLFGAKSPAPGGSLFGGTTAPSTGFSFGNPTSPAPAPTGLFGAAPSTGGLFGNSATTPAPTATTPAPSAGGGLFGAKSPAPAGGLFGAPAPSTGLFSSPPAAVAPLVTQQPSANQSLQQKMALIEHQRQENAKMEPWRGNSFSTSNKVSDVGKTVHTNSAVQYKIPRPLTSTPGSLARIRPRGFTPHMSTNVIKSSPTKAFGGINSASPSQTIASPINGSVKSLAIRSEVLTGTTPRVKHRVQLLTNGNDNPKVLQFENSEPSIPLEATVNEDLIPILTKPNYTTNPPISVLENMTETELATVESFSVEHSTHGSIRWIGDIDVRGVNLDDAVTICAKEAIVYAREEENGTKPKLGTKLNRAAVITLRNIYPKEGMDGDKYSSKIKRMTVKMGAKFVEYDFKEGVWVFEVDHFSRYGFIDDEDSSDDEDVDNQIDENVKPQQQLVPWDAAAKTYQSPFFMKKSQGRAVLINDETSEVDRRIEEGMDVDGVQRMAELAFAALDEGSEGDEVKALNVVSKSQQPEPVRLEPDDDEVDTIPTASSQRFDVSTLLPNVQKNFSIFRHAVGECSSKSQSRVHPRFRAGWSSCLSFVKLVPGSNNKITIVRPKLQCGDLSPNVPLLQLHRSSSIASKIGTHSEFSLPSAKAEMFAIIRKYASLHPATQMVNVLYGQNPEMDLTDGESTSKIDRARRRGAMLRFFTSILPANNMLEAVVAHDRKLACKLAFEGGYFHLSTLLASPCHQMDEQVALWQGTGYLSDLGDLELQRIYSILGNDLDIERELFSAQNARALSWQQRICIDLVRGYDIDLKDVILNYEKEVKEGEAPSPIGNSSVLYHLLRLSSIEGEKIQNSLNPSGYGASQHDYGLAWHLLQIFDLLAVSSKRHGIDRKLYLKVLYSMTSQLIFHRQYHWAIYVSLCTLTSRIQTQISRDSSMHNMNSDFPMIQELESAESAHVEFAKQIITRYIHVMPEEQIQFLTSATADGGLNIPIKWLKSARAQYAGYCGDDSSYVHALASAGMYDECARATRALILPKAVSQGGEKIKKLRVFLSDLAKATGDDIQRPFWSEPNGCGVFLELFELEDRVSDLLLGTSDHQVLDTITDRVEEELILLKKIEGRVLDFRGKGISDRPTYYLACRCEQETKFEAACVLHALSIIGTLKSQLRLLCEVADSLVDKSLAQITSIECALFGEDPFSSSRTDGIDRVRGAAGYFLRPS